ncbi:MAG: metallophosphoesterase [Candidatus Pacearchaeota archaeon]
MRILAIGDPHGNLDKIKKITLKNVDLILLTGDIGKADLARKIFFENQKRKQQGLLEVEETLKDVKAMHYEIHNSTISLLKYLSKYAKVYSIEGNVGIPNEFDIKKINKKLKINLPITKNYINKMKNIYIVKNSLRKINNLKIGFLEYFLDKSWVEEFKPKDYNEIIEKAKKQTEKAKKILEKFGEIDILICHQPPYGILDKINFPSAPKHWQGKHAGSKVILKYIKKYQPRYVFCGHIHEGKGKAKIGDTEIYNLGYCGWKIIEFKD